MNQARASILLGRAAQACAVAAALLLAAIVLVTCASVLGRNTTGWTLVGDFEFTAFAAGAAIALSLPWCQWQRGHVIVDFFTQRASARTRRRLDRLGAALWAALLGVLAWRAAVGGWRAWQSQNASMLLGLPEWWVYAVLVPSLALAAVIAAAQALGAAHPRPADGDAA
ncbi:MAG: TRAP transporter small permease [Rubrivivax sp.]|jgi:TRAP-type C4-dicarboxylate transport system permease small subunit